MKLAGHPAHAVSVHLPIGLLAVVPLWDALAWILGADGWWWMAYYTLFAGLVAAGLSALLGFVDYSELPEDVMPAANRHLAWNLGAIGLYLASLLSRGGPEPLEETIRIAAPVLSALGAVLLAVGGWYGGHLVYDHRVGVKDTGTEGH